MRPASLVTCDHWSGNDVTAKVSQLWGDFTEAWTEVRSVLIIISLLSYAAGCHPSPLSSVKTEDHAFDLLSKPHTARILLVNKVMLGTVKSIEKSILLTAGANTTNWGDDRMSILWPKHTNKMFILWPKHINTMFILWSRHTNKMFLLWSKTHKQHVHLMVQT